MNESKTNTEKNSVQKLELKDYDLVKLQKTREKLGRGNIVPSLDMQNTYIGKTDGVSNELFEERSRHNQIVSEIANIPLTNISVNVNTYEEQRDKIDEFGEEALVILAQLVSEASDNEYEVVKKE